jgi:surface-anchored protein
MTANHCPARSSRTSRPRGVPILALLLALGASSACGESRDGERSAAPDISGDRASTEPTESKGDAAPARGPGEDCELSYTEGHGDVFVVFDRDPPGLDWRLRSSFGAGAGETLADASRVCVVVPAASRVLTQSMGGAPVSEDYAFLGVAPGDPFWLIPQTPREGMPWFGISTENVPQALFTGDEIEFVVTEIETPDGGNLSAWSSGTFGAPSPIFATTVGKLAHSFGAGAHVHFNWGFTVAGRYALRLEVAGRRDGVRRSASNVLTFLVRP